MGNCSSFDSGILWTAVGGTALGLAAVLLAMPLIPRAEPAPTEAGVALERPSTSIPAVSTRANVLTMERERERETMEMRTATEPCPGEERSFVRLFEDAHVRPTYQQRSLLGVQIFAITPGSFWETIGVRTGDLIVEMNGQQIDSTEASVDLLKYLGTSPSIDLNVHALNGQDRQLMWEALPDTDPTMLPEHCRS